MSTIEQEIEEILGRPYHWVFVRDEDNGRWAGEILELPGCFADGCSLPCVVENLQRAASSWVKVALEIGAFIPDPRSDGKILYDSSTNPKG